MATIFYSMAGEGRGHASRARAVVERIRDHHRVVLVASDQAFEFLDPLFARDPNVEVKCIPGLRFHYTNGRLDLVKSIYLGLKYRSSLPRIVEELSDTIRKEKPDLAIADFEAALPRAAHACGVPVMSLDHQHFLTTYDLSSLPLSLSIYAQLMSIVVHMFRIRPSKIVVSAFFRPPLRPNYEHVTQIGPLLRKEVLAQRPHRGDYLLSYLRPLSEDQTLHVLRTTNREVRVYGLGERPDDGNLRFRAIHPRKFLDDLSGCQAVVSAAGNQLIGESLFLGKPFLALPERHHHEQRINSHFLKHMGCGDYSILDRFRPHHLRRFLRRLDSYERGLRFTRGQLDGTTAAVEAVESMLPGNGAFVAPPLSSGNSATMALV